MEQDKSTGEAARSLKNYNSDRDFMTIMCNYFSRTSEFKSINTLVDSLKISEQTDTVSHLVDDFKIHYRTLFKGALDAFSDFLDVLLKKQDSEDEVQAQYFIWNYEKYIRLLKRYRNDTFISAKQLDRLNELMRRIYNVGKVNIAGFNRRYENIAEEILHLI